MSSASSDASLWRQGEEVCGAISGELPNAILCPGLFSDSTKFLRSDFGAPSACQLDDALLEEQDCIPALSTLLLNSVASFGDFASMDDEPHPTQPHPWARSACQLHDTLGEE
eukprot:gene27136-2366_t